MLFYYLLFFLILTIFVITRAGDIRPVYSLLVIGVMLVLVAGFKKVGNDRDSINYLDYFLSVGSPGQYFTEYKVNYFYEPFYYLVPSVLAALGIQVWLTFLVVAVIGVGLKFLAIQRLTELVFLSVLVYIGHFFILHEMTQIRAGVMSGCVLLCIPEIYQRNHLRFALFILIGILFHYSILIFVPFYFLDGQSLHKRTYLLLLYVPYLLYFLNINPLTILQSMSLGLISEKIAVYNQMLQMGDGSAINVFNTIFLIQLALCTFLIIKSHVLAEHNKYAFLLIKIYSWSACFFVLFSAIPIAAFRLSEVLQIVQVIVVPFLVYLVRPKYVAMAAVIAFALAFFTFDLYYNEFLFPYFK
ncbi:EpsG family protein [Hufsiella ginkgonis]|uniref:EpsG family protein n=1 Tax=Hufsiella ginkgonis TaxID=2695274 RepID=A0A7K1Y2Y2_9SPHI|nr:EpsG family protein [Hufsiella ginkgonis]MXV17379.1 hypothetical protein [Hufsiella ginkgonis]